MNWMEKGISIIIFALVCYAGVMPCLTITGCKKEVDSTAQIDCNVDIHAINYDRDQDGISDDVENNNRNQINCKINNTGGTYSGIPHPQFDPDKCNSNPSVANGTFDNGSLTGGINLPDEAIGKDGYYHYIGSGDWYDFQDADDWGTLALINIIEKTGLAFGSNPAVGIGDMSVKGGDDIPSHASHENGTDVDVRYVRNDGWEDPLDLRPIPNGTPEKYDRNATLKLIKLFVSNGSVTNIFVDTTLTKITNKDVSVVSHLSGHYNHFHVRITKP